MINQTKKTNPAITIAKALLKSLLMATSIGVVSAILTKVDAKLGTLTMFTGSCLMVLLTARKKLPLNYWRSKNGHEVDFLIGERTAIEVKASKKISRNDFKGLNYLKEEGIFKNFILVSQDPISTHVDNILALPWQKFLTDLWKDTFI